MITKDRKTIAGMAVSASAIGLLAWAVISSLGLLGCGCSSTPAYATNAPATPPNFAQVEPSVYRGGHPASLAQWKYIQNLGVSNIIDFATAEQTDDSIAVKLGMKVHRHPVTPWQMLVTGPDPKDFTQGVLEITPGSMVKCLEGRDRTGTAIGQYRLLEGTNKAAAYQEMLDKGFRPALKGLHEYWENLPEKVGVK